MFDPRAPRHRHREPDFPVVSLRALAFGSIPAADEFLHCIPSRSAYFADPRGSRPNLSHLRKRPFRSSVSSGNAAVPKILEALASADKRQTVEYVELLSSLTDDKTLPVIARGLTEDEPRIVSGTAWALSTNRRYNFNRLVDFLGEDGYLEAGPYRSALGAQGAPQRPPLLQQVYNLQPSEKAALFKLIDEVTTEEMVPDSSARMDGKDPVVKMHLLNVIARFDLRRSEQGAAGRAEGSEQARTSGRARRHRRARKARSTSQRSPGLLLDPDLEVMNKAVEVICRANDPETAKYLIAALKAENEYSRRAAVEILNEIGTTHSIKYLLDAITDEDWWVRSRASDALAHIGGPRVVDAVLDLIKDKDENMRRAAIEILVTCRDKRAVDKLIEATRDPDWWVSERAADALAEIGDAKALPRPARDGRAQQPLSAHRAERGRQGRRPTNSSTRCCRTCSGRRRDVARRRDRRRRATRRRAARRGREALHTAGRHGRGRDRRRARQTRLCRSSTAARRRAVRRRRLSSPLPTPMPAPGPTMSPTRAATAPSRAARGPTMIVQPPPAPVHASATSTARTLLVEGADERVEPPPPEAPSFDLNALNPGDMIEGRYKFIQKIGKGAFGTVRARRGHGRRGTPDSEVLECERGLATRRCSSASSTSCATPAESRTRT